MLPKKVITRFAPSPSGHLHLGHAYAAIFAERAARNQGGQFLLRIEDIDQSRCRLRFEDSIKEDLRWLGLNWTTPIYRQSDHFSNYQKALEKLNKKELLYPCFCTRNNIQEEIAQSNRAPQKIEAGPFGLKYSGKCRQYTRDERQSYLASGAAFALRLDMSRALSLVTDLQWRDRDEGIILAKPEIFGDVVLARKDVPTSYHLSVTVDDNLQQIGLVTRGEDLRLVTHIHRLLQELLDFDVPDYQFHALLIGKDGRKYSKRDKSLTLRSLRQAGHTPKSIRKMIEVD